jgi:hypothetical protein
MAVTINASTSAGLVQTADTSGVLQLQTNSGTTAVTIDTSQRVGIGTASPSNKLDIQTSASTTVRLTGGNATNQGSGYFIANTAQTQTLLALSDDAQINGGTPETLMSIYSTKPLLFYSNAAERMRINTNGNLLIGTTTEAANETPLVLSKNSGTTRWSVGPFASVPNNFYITGTSAAQGVYLNGTSATSWSGLSDERYKTDLKNIENAIDKISTLRAVTGKFTEDEEQKSRSFLIAQDVQKVLPEAVDDSNPDRLGLAYTDTIPLLVAAIKEQQTLIVSQSELINDLTARITALEGAA